MSDDLLIVEQERQLVVTEAEATVLVSDALPEVVVVTEVELLTELAEDQTVTVVEVVTEVIELHTPGPQGPPGAGGGGGPSEPVQNLDLDGPQHYVGYAGRVVRVDYSTSPSTVASATGAWADRETLTYT